MMPVRSDEVSYWGVVGVVELGDEHRRHAVNRGATLFVHCLQRRQRIELRRRQNQRGAVNDRLQRAHDAAEAVIKRNRQAELVGVGPLQSAAHQVGVIDQVVVGEQNPFRLARRSRRVLDIHHVVNAGAFIRRPDARGDHGPPLIRPQQNRMLQRQCPALPGGGQNFAVMRARVLFVKKNRLHPRALEDVRQVVGAVRRIDVDENGAYLRRRHLQVDPFDAIRGPHADSVAGPNAEAPKTRCCFRDAGAQVGVSQPQSLVAGDHRLFMRMLRNGLVERLADCFFEESDALTRGVALHFERILQSPAPQRPTDPTAVAKAV